MYESQGYTKKQTYRRPFTSAVRRMNLGLAEMQFSAVCLDGLLALFGLFLVDLLSRSQFLPTTSALFLCTSGQIKRPMLSKSVGIRTLPEASVAPPVRVAILTNIGKWLTYDKLMLMTILGTRKPSCR